MVFVRKKFRDDRPVGKLDAAYRGASAIIRWVAVPGAGIALSLWFVTGLAGAYSASGSLSSATFMPHVSRNLAGGMAVQQEKSARLINVAIAGSTGKAHSAEVSSTERFAMVASRAALSPQKLAAAFAKSGMVLAKHVPTAPLKERFDVASSSVQHHPTPARFGQRSEAERSSRLALALAAPASIELAYAVASAPSSDAPFSKLFVTPEDMLGMDGDDDVAIFDDLPDDIPLPSRRPQMEKRLADKPDASPPSRVATAPKKPAAPQQRERGGNTLLAFAKPDNPREGGGFLSDLFSNKPRARNGVAVYDISAATVTMPDGTKLEAHSGIGHMADNPKYADQKMRGPTPPGNYKLSMREALFHGVEAIRMTPTSGKVKYGRDGMLAHTELLRGRPGQSHGCVAFKDYNRFLAAFKRGKVTHMIVVPGNGRRSPGTRVADAGRGA